MDLHSNPLYESIDLRVKWEYLKKPSLYTDPSGRVLHIVERLSSIWPDSIKMTTARRPNISRGELFEALRHAISNSQLNTDLIIAYILRSNDELREMPLKHLFGTESLCDRKRNMYNKACSNNFFLNLDSLYPPSVWAIKLAKHLNVKYI